jgi:hypothetical protein
MHFELDEGVLGCVKCWIRCGFVGILWVALFGGRFLVNGFVIAKVAPLGGRNSTLRVKVSQ